MSKSPWIEAMRLRTLPVSVAGVLMGVAMAIANGYFARIPATLCLIFAVLAQIASNFANEYYDFKSGLDKPGREGPRRGVTEGDITPQAMKYATYGVLAAACLVGLSLIAWGGWWLIAIGAAIAIGVIAYSAGPYPLSHHALGEIAVIFFFGIIPVNMTYYLQAGDFAVTTLLASLAIGLMGANVLIVNNYRDAEADASVGKITFAVKFGRRSALSLYMANGIVAAILLIIAISLLNMMWARLIVAAYVPAHIYLTLKIKELAGAQLNPYLGKTSLLMFFTSLAMLIFAIF